MAKKGGPPAAIRTLEDGLANLGERGEEQARLLCSLANIYLRQGDADRSIACCKEGLKAFSHSRESTVGAQIYMASGCAYLEEGEIRRAKYYIERAIQGFDSRGDL